MRWLAVLLPLLASESPRTQRHYELELLYVIHSQVTAASYPRIEALFAKVCPDCDLDELAPDQESVRAYFLAYRTRLLEGADKRADLSVIDDAEGIELVKAQLDRELRVRAILEHLLAQARILGSVKAVLTRLEAKDDAETPVCATEPGKGLVVYRQITGTSSELEALADRGVRFGLEFRRSVQLALFEELPAFGRRSYTFGSDGHGRHIFRLVSVRDVPEPAAK